MMSGFGLGIVSTGDRVIVLAPVVVVRRLLAGARRAARIGCGGRCGQPASPGGAEQHGHRQ
jgi:hypothetical protein